MYAPAQHIASVRGGGVLHKVGVRRSVCDLVFRETPVDLKNGSALVVSNMLCRGRLLLVICHSLSTPYEELLQS